MYNIYRSASISITSQLENYKENYPVCVCYCLSHKLGDVAGNPLVCGCDLAWVPENPQKEMLQGAVCANGQLVGNLQTEDFADC